MPIKISVEIKPIRGIAGSSINVLSMANKYLWFGLMDGNVMRFSLDDEYLGRDSPRFGDVSSSFTLLKTKGPRSEVRQIYLDSKSFHCLICLVSGDHWYTNLQNNDIFYLKSLQKVFIRSLSFTEMTNEDDTGPFLIGTQQGSIIEGRIDYKLLKFSFRPFHSLGEEEPILNVEMIPIILNNVRSYLVVAISTKRLYEFFGGKTLEETFRKYNDTAKDGLKYEVPLAAPYGELLVVDKDDGTHDLFWTNSTCIIYSSIPRKIDADATSCLSFPPVIISYPSSFKHLINNKDFHTNDSNSFLNKPTEQIPKNTIALNYHLLLLFDEAIVAINTIVNQQVSSLVLPYGTYGELKRLIRDPISGLICLLTSDGIYEVFVQNESEDSWNYYMLKGEIDNALSCCNNTSESDIVLLKAAEDYYERGMYEESARMYVRIRGVFPEIEVVYLNFIKLRQEFALIEYIISKIQMMDISRAYPRFIILTIWLVEMMSYKLKDLQLTIQNSTNEGIKEMYNKLKERFSRLLVSIKDIDELGSSVNFLLHTNGCGDECIEYAKLRNDIATVVCYYISNGNYGGALNELSQMPPGEKRDSLFLRFAPLIFINVSNLYKGTKFNKLNPNLQIPILALPIILKKHNYLSNSLEIIRKLLYTIEDTDEHTKSTLWSLYIILLSNLEHETELLNVLSSDDQIFTKLDLSIALRYLKKKSLENDKWIEPFIHLQCHCGMVDDALDLALYHNNLQLAQTCAMKPQNHFHKRKLWLKILKSNKYKHNATLLISQSKNHLQIHDVLEYLQEDVNANELKDLIDDFLTQYDDNMREKRLEIQQLCNSIEDAKININNCSKRCVSVMADERCSVCGQVACVKNFIVYPCGHVFHRNCVVKVLKNLLVGAELVKLDLLRSRCEEVGDEKAFEDLNDYLAKACLICGYPIILLASQPFINSNDDWAIN